MHHLGLDDVRQYHVNPFQDVARLSHKRTKDLRALAAFLKKYSSRAPQERASMMMSNGHVPVANQTISAGGELPYSLGDFTSCYDRFVVEATSALRDLCSPETLEVLSFNI